MLLNEIVQFFVFSLEATASRPGCGQYLGVVGGAWYKEDNLGFGARESWNQIIASLLIGSATEGRSHGDFKVLFLNL